MNKNTAATIIVLFGLIGYLLLRFSLPAFQIQRFIFIAVFTLAGVILMFMHRREKKKPAS